jgi:Anthranilate/para-aminobenzoate synthases component I
MSVYLKISSPDRFNFILESVERGEQIGRYSFIGSSENFYIRTKKDTVEIYNKGQIEYKKTTDPIGEIKNLVEEFKPYKDESLPPFYGGFVGYIGYDVIHFYEPIPDIKIDTLKIPDLFMFLSDEVIAFDNLTNKIKIIVCAIINKNEDLKIQYDKAVKNPMNPKRSYPISYPKNSKMS